MPSKSCFAQAVFRKKRAESTGKRRVYMVLRNNLLGTENGVMRCDVEEIVTVIAQREERFKRR
jgi:hypothetical protein